MNNKKSNVLDEQVKLLLQSVARKLSPREVIGKALCWLLCMPTICLTIVLAPHLYESILGVVESFPRYLHIVLKVLGLVGIDTSASQFPFGLGSLRLLAAGISTMIIFASTLALPVSLGLCGKASIASALEVSWGLVSVGIGLGAIHTLPSAALRLRPIEHLFSTYEALALSILVTILAFLPGYLILERIQ